MTDQKDMTINDDVPEEVFLRVHNGNIQLSDDGDPIAFSFTRTDTLNQQAATPSLGCEHLENVKRNISYLFDVANQLKDEVERHEKSATPAPVELPADQDAVRELVDAVKALDWEDTVTDLDGAIEEWGGFTDQEGKDRLFAALARLEREQMAAARETKNIWWYLFGFHDYGERKAWRGWRLLSRSFWRGYNARYIWHDSVGAYLMRPVCKLRGHGQVKDVSEPARLEGE